MTDEAKRMLEQIEADVKGQKDFELSIAYDAKRRNYLVKELKKAMAATGMAFTAEEFEKFLHDLDDRLFPKRK